MIKMKEKSKYYQHFRLFFLFIIYSYSFFFSVSSSYLIHSFIHSFIHSNWNWEKKPNDEKVGWEWINWEWDLQENRWNMVYHAQAHWDSKKKHFSSRMIRMMRGKKERERENEERKRYFYLNTMSMTVFNQRRILFFTELFLLSSDYPL